MSDFKQIIDNVSNIENLDNTTILKILEKFDKEISKYAEKQSGLSHIYNVDFIPLENGLTYANGEVDILGTLKFTIEDNVVVEKPANIKLNIKGDSYIVVDSDETGNSLVIREDDELYHKVESFSNPNLLINGDFRVNQRGEEVYNGPSVYCVDRWKIQESFISYNVTSKTLTNSGTSNGYLFQKVEDTVSLLGKTLTYSAKIDGVVYSETINMPLSLPTNNQIIGNRVTHPKGTIYIYYYLANKTIGCVLALEGGKTMTIDYVKLEIGSVATPFSPRPYAEELAMCQRYFYKIKSNYAYGLISTGMQSSTTSALYLYFLPQQMRTSPTLTFSDLSHFRCHLGYTLYKTPTALETNNTTFNQIGIKATYEAVSTNTGVTELTFQNSSGYIDIDAEIQ